MIDLLLFMASILMTRESKMRMILILFGINFVSISIGMLGSHREEFLSHGEVRIGKVLRHVKGKSKRVSLKAPNVQKIYANNFNAVDRNDRDSADYTCSIRTNRWYLRIFFWLLDRAIFAIYIVLVARYW